MKEAKCPVNHNESSSFSTLRTSAPTSTRRIPIINASREVRSWFTIQTGNLPCPNAAAKENSRCPVQHDNNALNPKNMMPYNLPQAPLQSSKQKSALPLQRTISTIPRSQTDTISTPHNSAADDEDESHWVYPSEQQFYNALARKGYETDETDIPVILAIHNDLNEQSWQQVCQWEREATTCVPKLARFIGRPGDLSPRARFFGLLGSPKPFDRHDWIVDRCGKEVRYILDYYEAPHVPGQANFYVDCRPAADSIENLWARARHYFRSNTGNVTIN